MNRYEITKNFLNWFVSEVSLQLCKVHSPTVQTPIQIDFTHPFSRRLSYSMRLEALVIPCEVSRAHIFSFTKNKLLPVSPDKVQPCSVCHRKFFFPKKDMEICTIDAVVSDFSSVRALTNTAFLVGKSCLTCTRTHSLQLEKKS